jgi:hypothetical protein
MIPSSRNCSTNAAGIGARRNNRENFRSRSTPTGEVYLTGEGVGEEIGSAMRVEAGEAAVRRSEGQRAVATVAMVTPAAVGERSERSVLVMRGACYPSHTSLSIYERSVLVMR